MGQQDVPDVRRAASPKWSEKAIRKIIPTPTQNTTGAQV